ncbi:DNA alkylation repair protein [Candidatus Bipolaricaulota bacterium]|nr:DNA alkylation repair protein [Candidatus Bipolaricaulota bacterium]
MGRCAVSFYRQVIAEMGLLGRTGSNRTPTASAEQYWHMGIATPTVRKLAKRFSKSFRCLAWQEQVAAVVSLLEYGSDEAAHLAVFLLGHVIDTVDTVDADALSSMLERFRGWSVTDAFCIEVLQPLLERFPSDVLSMTTRWSTTASLWKRRASVVIFTRKIGASGRYTEDGLRAADRLIDDAADLVRKGVGWALKDLLRGERETVLEYVAALRKKGVTSVITLYALRDVRGDDRRRILAIKPGHEPSGI